MASDDDTLNGLTTKTLRAGQSTVEPSVMYAAQDAQGQLHGDVVWTTERGYMTRQRFHHGKPIGVWECMNVKGTATFGTRSGDRICFAAYIFANGTARLSADNEDIEVDITDDGTRTMSRKGVRVRRVYSNGKVELGDISNGEGTITYPDPHEKKGEEPWVIREEGEFKDGKLVEGIRTKKDSRGVIYRYTAKGTLLKDPEDAALGQKLKALTELIDRQAKEIETLREQLKHE